MPDNELLRLLEHARGRFLAGCLGDGDAPMRAAIKLVEEGKETSDLLGLRGPCLVIPLPAKVEPTEAQREKARAAINAGRAAIGWIPLEGVAGQKMLDAAAQRLADIEAEEERCES